MGSCSPSIRVSLNVRVDPDRVDQHVEVSDVANGWKTFHSRLERFRYLSSESDPAWRRFVGRVLDVRNVGWDIGVRAMERAAGYKRGERLDFRLRASTRDLLTSKGKAVRGEVEALADAVMKAGSYPAREEAARALNAVMEVVRDRVPPELLLKLSDHLPAAEASRLRRVASERLKQEEGFPVVGGASPRGGASLGGGS